MAVINEGFKGQRLIVLPFYELDKMENNELTKDLQIHSLGHYPNAKYHFYERAAGSEEYILIYCVKGRGKYILEGKEYPVKENQLFIIPPRAVHSYSAADADAWSIYWIHFKGSAAGYFADEFRLPVDIFTEGGSKKTKQIHLFDQMYDTLRQGFEEERLVFASICLRYFLGNFKFANSFKDNKIPNEFGRNIVHLATHYINENIEKKISIRDMAQHFKYSPSYFYRLFYSATGCAPKQYIDQLKIRRAMDLLVNSEYKICQISTMLGFDDPYYFSRMFSKYTNMSPSNYRKENKVG